MACLDLPLHLQCVLPLAASTVSNQSFCVCRLCRVRHGWDCTKAADMRRSEWSTAVCQPPCPTVLPSHVPPDINDTTLPIWKIKGAIWTGSGCCVLSYIPAVAARITDMINTATGRSKLLNFTPQQWKSVRSCRLQYCLAVSVLDCARTRQSALFWLYLRMQDAPASDRGCAELLWQGLWPTALANTVLCQQTGHWTVP
jgi:hypothetical protein